MKSNEQAIEREYHANTFSGKIISQHIVFWGFKVPFPLHTHISTFVGKYNDDRLSPEIKLKATGRSLRESVDALILEIMNNT
jgi:hypothetical protein